MASNVSVTWETISDGRTRQGANLPSLLSGLIAAGYSLDVETPEGTRTFTDASEFLAWFDSLGPTA